MKTKLIIAALGVALAGIGMNAYAITPTPTTTAVLSGGMGVSLQLTSACTLALTQGIVFTRVSASKAAGSWASAPATLTATGCGPQYNLAADGGGHAGSTSSTRRLIGGTTATQFLDYSLAITGTTPSMGVQQWGDTGRQLASATNPDLVYAVTAGTDTDSFSIVATATLVGTPSTVSAQTYTDTVVVTVEF